MDKVVMIIVGVIWAIMSILRAIDYVSLTTYRVVLIVLGILYIIFLNRKRLIGKKEK